MHQSLSRQVGDANEAIERLIRSVSTSICARSGVEVVFARAYADYSVLDDGSGIQRDLTQMGCDPKFTDSSVQLNAPELQLCVDAVRIGAARPEIGLFVVVSGNRPYLPLLQHLRASGKQIVLVALRMPPSRDLAGLGNGHFVDAAKLLSDSRKSGADQQVLPDFVSGIGTSVREFPDHVEVDDYAGLETLRIIEEHFGHYDEVYLTPLLRKLTEDLDESSDDPKSIIAELEKMGAVWLEKRTGYPYDYTVLLIDREHPTVARIRDEIASDADYDDEDSYSDEDDYRSEIGESVAD